ncbi:MAG: hypothetical protein RIR00_2111 [Pseudomonadota bacterium]
MDEQLDTAVLLARFKLMVRRQLAESLDLDQLTANPDYARSRLAELEEKAEDVDLLVMLLKVRSRLFPTPLLADRPPPASPPPEASVAPDPTAPTPPTRAYKFGARSW